LTQENTNASFYAAIDVGDFAEVSEMSVVVAADGFVVWLIPLCWLMTYEVEALRAS
jgi:hypothetical protein